MWAPSIRRGYHLPGTPLGLGERQVFELHDGTTSVIEIVDYEPGRRAVTIHVSPKPVARILTVYSLEPIEGGCELSLGCEIDVPTGQRVHPGYADAWHAWTQADFDNIRRALAASDSETAPKNP
jgi:hypothetical protein